MGISPLSGSGGIDEVWGDQSGGTLIFSVSDTTSSTLHQLRVRAFSTDGLGTFTDVSGGKSATIQDEAENLANLIAALYPASVTVAMVGINQTSTDHTTEFPYAYTGTTPSSYAGAAGGSRDSLAIVDNFNGRGTDGSRWRLTLPGLSNAILTAVAGKVRWPSVGAGAALNLIQYLTGQANGPIHATKTQVVTHNGVPIDFNSGSVTTMYNKRLRRKYGLV